MSEPSPDPQPAPVFARLWAVRIGAVILLVFAVIVALGFYDDANRRTLEVLSETTSVGDLTFLTPPDPIRLPATLATLEGRRLQVVDATPIEVRDSHTRRVGRDRETGVTIYELSPAATAEERERIGPQKPAYLLKLQPSQYLVARPTTAAK